MQLECYFTLAKKDRQSLKASMFAVMNKSGNFL